MKFTMSMKSKFAAIALLVSWLMAAAPSSVAAESAPSVKQLAADFRKLGFGMFIHYNMATYLDKQWVEGYPDPSTFNPSNPVDTDAWADAAASAGMKYAVLTTKHVGGFCLWDSKYTTYDVMHPDCPVQEDLVAKFIKSFTSRGLKVGLYYCWRSPGFKKQFKVLPPECDPAEHDFAQQVDFQKKQVTELVENYPEVFYIWNDALDDRIMTREDANAFADDLRDIRPGLLLAGNWWDWKKKGSPFLDIAVTETRHFPQDNTAPGETCWQLERGRWFSGTRTVNQAEPLVADLKKANARNANFLLNVGPDQQGRILESSVEVLAKLPALLGGPAR